MLELPVGCRERAMKWSEFLTHGFAIRGTGAVLVLPVLRDRVIKLVRAIRVALQKRLVNRPPRVIDAADCMRVSNYLLFVIWSELDTMPTRVMS